MIGTNGRSALAGAVAEAHHASRPASRLGLGLTTALLAMFAAAQAAAPLEAQRAAPVTEAARAAVVTLKVYNAAGTEIDQGSGFFVEDGRIVTSTLVVEGAARIEVFGSDGRLLGSVPHIEAMSRAASVAILPRPGGSPPAVLRLDEALPTGGAAVVAVGAPIDADETSDHEKTGAVADVRVEDGVTIVTLVLSITPPMSGSPVLNERGAVIGVAIDIAELESDSTSMAIASRDIAVLLGSAPGQIAFPARPRRAQPRALAMDETVNGALTTEDPQLDDGEHYALYSFDGQEGERVVITLTSNVFDAYLIVVHSDPEWSFDDDDTGGGTDAQATVTLPYTGRYTIIVTSFEGGETGAYTLSMTRATP